MVLESANVERNELRTYVRADVAVVYKTKDVFGGLSNMAAGFPIYLNGVKILTSEALYQACRFPHMPELQREIVRQSSPMTAKMKSKAYRIQSRSDWADINFRVMRWCLRVKLAQNYETFGGILLKTEGLAIVEQSRKDSYWGALLSHDGVYLVGRNVLGRLLMELREGLKEDFNGRLRAVPVLDVHSFELFGQPLGIVTEASINAVEAQSTGSLF